MPGGAKYISDVINVDMKAADLKSRESYVKSSAETNPNCIKALKEFNSMNEDIFKFNPGYISDTCERGLEVWSECATIRVGLYDSVLEVWKWNKSAARNLDINIPMDMTEADEDENMEKHRPDDEELAPKQEPDQDQQNAEAQDAAQPDPGATPRPAPEMTQQPPNKISRNLEATGTL